MGSRLFMKSTIFWNCRGIGSLSIINALQSLVRAHSPEILFISETKSNKKEIRRLQDRSICVEANGRAGGLALFWSDEVDVKVTGKCDHFIDCMVSGDGVSSWRLTGIYGWPENSQKHRTWEMINSLRKDRGDPWPLGGDFNEILHVSDKRGGVARSSKNLRDFQNCMDINGLREMHARGYKYTWSNKRREGLIEEKLDRFLANSDWWNAFPNASVTNLV